ncbi:MAG: hypothetical protein ACLP0H_03985 [Terriglobales bacterium]
MPSYPVTIRRCHHLKVNGTQCGSPALRREKHCYYHMRWHSGAKFHANLRANEIAGLPILEDANSIQVGLAEVMRQLVTKQIDHRTAGLLLYALQTASANLRMTSFEPEPTRVVIDRKSVARRPIGASAWSRIEGREYDDLTENNSSETDSLENDSSEDDSPSASGEDAQRKRCSESWRTKPETPENERLLPNESQRDRYIRVQKQKGLEVDPDLI